jgi:hypothetical protein
MHLPLQRHERGAAVRDAARFVVDGGRAMVTNTMTKERTIIAPSPAMMAHTAFTAPPSAA